MLFLEYFSRTSVAGEMQGEALKTWSAYFKNVQVGKAALILNNYLIFITQAFALLYNSINFHLFTNLDFYRNYTSAS